MYRTPFSCPASAAKRTIKPFPIEKLRFFINYVGWQIDLQESESQGNSLIDMNKECSMVSCKHLEHITNGEYFYALQQIIWELNSDEPKKDLVLYKEAIFGELFADATSIFLDYWKTGDFSLVKDTAQELWDLYEYCQIESGLTLWEDNEGNEVKAPEIEKIKIDDWNFVIDTLNNHLFWDYDCNLLISLNFSQFIDQPHEPTFGEYRRAMVWLKDTYETLNEQSESGELLIEISN
jgi:hypothetical protein